MSRGRNIESRAAQGARRATEAAPDSARRGKVRWSARRKVTVVLELMRGVELEATSRKYAVTSWRDAFLQGGEDGLKSRTREVADEEKKTLKSAVTGLVMDNDLLKERIRQLEDENPFLRWRSNR